MLLIYIIKIILFLCLPFSSTFGSPFKYMVFWLEWKNEAANRVLEWLAREVCTEFLLVYSSTIWILDTVKELKKHIISKQSLLMTIVLIQVG